jgi:hypothetical protein
MTATVIHEYIQSLDKELAAGNTTEHTHRPALKALFQSLNPAITATNEPQHITAVGAPDFRIIQKCPLVMLNVRILVKTSMKFWKPNS